MKQRNSELDRREREQPCSNHVQTMFKPRTHTPTHTHTHIHTSCVLSRAAAGCPFWCTFFTVQFVVLNPADQVRALQTARLLIRSLGALHFQNTRFQNGRLDNSCSFQTRQNVKQGRHVIWSGRRLLC